MTIDDLRNNGLIILECISGSRAYGLNTEHSDTDIKGVFILPKEQYYGLHYIAQVSNETNDVVFYELGRFMELLAANNPNILELLYTPETSIIYKHAFLDIIKPEWILSKLCCSTFGNFALSQIKKAKGLKKKIVNPVEKERKSVLSFCFVSYNQGSMPLEKYLDMKEWKQEHCGLVKIPNMQDIYGLYYDGSSGFNGIIRSKDSNEVCLSAIPKGMKQHAFLYFNKNGYSTYCKEYREYWAWVEKRNEDRYENTKSHGKNYDAKNMMHVFRLLDMAIEIGREHMVKVERPNRAFLLNIKSGNFDYEALLKMAEEKRQLMEKAFENSSLPDVADLAMINDLTFRLRDKFYNERGV